MDALIQLFDLIQTKQLANGNLLGMLNVLIGRKITGPKGNVLSSGFAFRDLAAWLKKTRWDPNHAKEIHSGTDALPPRDRQRYWFAVICQAQVDSEEAKKAGERFAAILAKEGYMVK